MIQFTVITGDSIANYTYLTVHVRTSNEFKSLVLNKMQEPMRTSLPNYAYSNYKTETNTGLNFYTTYKITQTTTGVNPWNVPNTLQTYQHIDPYPYLSANGGYLYNCNISVNSNYTAQTWDDVKVLYPEIPNPTTITTPPGGRDYVIYDQSILTNPKSTYKKYKWDYTTNPTSISLRGCYY